MGKADRDLVASAPGTGQREAVPVGVVGFDAECGLCGGAADRAQVGCGCNGVVVLEAVARGHSRRGADRQRVIGIGGTVEAIDFDQVVARRQAG